MDGPRARRRPDAVADVFSAAFARETGTLETAWWVPLLFGTAGIIIGLGHTLGDTLRLKIGAKDPNAKDPNAKDRKDPIDAGSSPDALATFVDACPGRPAFGWEPAPSVVGACIALFAVQYASSGVLATTVDPAFPGAPRYAVDAALAASGVGAWGVFDGTRQGLVVAVATAVAGPFTEIFLINVTHLYHYENPDVFGIPSWITWVYFCGSPAVGNLSRAVRARRRRALGLRTPTCEVAVATPKKAWRPPPRGNQRGERRGATAVEQPARGKMTVLATAENSGAAPSTPPTNRATSTSSNRDSSDESRDDATTNASATDDAVANAASKRATPSPDLHPTPSTRDRVASARRDLEWMRSLRREVRELQALKARLEALRARAADAAPPILPMIERRLEERVPEKYRDRLETFEDAFEREVLPRLPEGVRRRVGSRTEREGAKEARRDALRGVAGALEEVREDLTVLSAKLEELRETEVGNDEETSDDAEETQRRRRGDERRRRRRRKMNHPPRVWVSREGRTESRVVFHTRAIVAHARVMGVMEMHGRRRDDRVGADDANLGHRDESRRLRLNSRDRPASSPFVASVSGSGTMMLASAGSRTPRFQARAHVHLASARGRRSVVSTRDGSRPGLRDGPART